MFYYKFYEVILKNFSAFWIYSTRLLIYYDIYDYISLILDLNLWVFNDKWDYKMPSSLYSSSFSLISLLSVFIWLTILNRFIISSRCKRFLWFTIFVYYFVFYLSLRTFIMPYIRLIFSFITYINIYLPFFSSINEHILLVSFWGCYSNCYKYFSISY